MSEEKTKTNILRVKLEKGKTIKIMHLEDDETRKEKAPDETSQAGQQTEEKDETDQQEEDKTKSDMPPIEFEDQMYELLQDAEMEAEHQDMT